MWGVILAVFFWVVGTVAWFISLPFVGQGLHPWMEWTIWLDLAMDWLWFH